MRAVVKGRGGNPARAVRWYFPAVEEYGTLLSGHGFAVHEIILVPRLTPLKVDMQGWLRTFCRFFSTNSRSPGEARILAEMVDLLKPSLCDSQGRWTIELVRLRFTVPNAARVNKHLGKR